MKTKLRYGKQFKGVKRLLFVRPSVFSPFLYKEHHQDCNYRDYIDNGEKIIIALSFFAELPKFTGKYPDVRNKEHYQKSKKFNAEKHFLKTTSYQSREIYNNKKYKEI
jgi:hypothetical protein